MSNENKYIESAKIAAETAASNTQLTMVVTMICTMIALIGTGLTAWFAYKSAYRTAVVDTLSKQRIEWLNNLRGKFVEFNTLATEFYYNKNNPHQTNYNVFDKFNLLDKTKNHIRLLLNPKEPVAKGINVKFQEVINLLLDENSFDSSQLGALLLVIDNLQQIILKAEWKRIKEEIKKGRELNPDEVSKIYMNVSEKLKLKI
ncbi:MULTISPECIES: hypothetical protein [Bacillus]|uniref:hypothetical protein n=1 Tax=Bacillus TaxID=1386 RepID=UPI00071D43DB|nr:MULTISPECIES: hypothetical protein [Bacillus]KRV45050.1 hypothetical protein AS196_01500 [Bacillus sp. TH007]MEC1009876.1 hypothetical protein [Bacillus altitudinis]